MQFNGPLRRNQSNPRYFTDDSGQAIYLTGSHTWAVVQDMWLENELRHNMDYDGFLQMLADNGHNFLRFWQFSLYTKNCPWNNISTLFDPLPFERTGPGLAKDGLPKFDLTRPAPAYFNRLRARVEKASEYGIYVSVMLFEAWGLKWATPDQQPWEYHVFNPENNVNATPNNLQATEGKYAGNYVDVFSLKHPDILAYQKLFIRQVVDTLNDLDNVLYEICNEVPNTPEALQWQEHLCQYLREYEQSRPKQHPIGVTSEGGDQINEELFQTSADWISPSNGNAFEYRYNPPLATGEKVILTDTDHLWGHGCEVAWIWKSFTRGMNVLFMDPWEPIPGDRDRWQDGDITRNQRYYYAWDDMRRNLGYTRNVSLSFDLNKCVPDPHFCTSTYCLANKNEQYVCFFPAGGFEGLDLTGLDGEFQVEWLNPLTGVTIKGQPLPAKSNSPHAVFQRAALRAPFDGPAVLLLYKQRKVLPRRYKVYVVGK
ncbi:MAG: DUF4038 domain-containing protein [Anaerolineae bacterium]|nr:DUF4038 domain-containing protein [Anaerolineae bacterium]